MWGFHPVKISKLQRVSTWKTFVVYSSVCQYLVSFRRYLPLNRDVVEDPSKIGIFGSTFQQFIICPSLTDGHDIVNF